MRIAGRHRCEKLSCVYIATYVHTHIRAHIHTLDCKCRRLGWRQDADVFVVALAGSRRFVFRNGPSVHLVRWNQGERLANTSELLRTTGRS